jgi:hypothetical protein
MLDKTRRTEQNTEHFEMRWLNKLLKSLSLSLPFCHQFTVKHVKRSSVVWRRWSMPGAQPAGRWTRQGWENFKWATRCSHATMPQANWANSQIFHLSENMIWPHFSWMKNNYIKMAKVYLISSLKFVFHFYCDF